MEEGTVSYSFDGKQQELPEQQSDLTKIVTLSQELQTQLHLIITISSETDRTAIENIITHTDVHCMLTEIISTARMHLEASCTPALSSLSQLVIYHICAMLDRITQQIQEIFLIDSTVDTRFLSSWRTSRMPLHELETSFELLRCRFSRLLTVLSVQPQISAPTCHKDGMEEIPLDD